MNDNKNSVDPADFVTRDEILKLLSAPELARVSTAEATPPLCDGDEYIDLERLEQGVRLAQADRSPNVPRVLPRSAVSDGTWSKIVARLVAGQKNAHRA